MALDQAESFARRSLELDPIDPSGLNALALILNQRGKNAEAIAVAKRAIELSPSFAGARFVLGIQLLRAGDSAEALRVLRDAMLLDPRPPPAWHSVFALALYAEGETDRAVELQESIRTTHPELILARTALVIHYATSGRIEEVRPLVSRSSSTAASL